MPPESRGPDILTNTSIPLSATAGGDFPLQEVARPPEGASNDPADRAAGVPGEITPEDMGAAAAARRGEASPDGDKPPALKTDGEKPPAKPPAKPDAAAKPDGDDIDVSDLDKALPNYAVKEITKARRATRAEVAAAKEAAIASEAARAAATEEARVAREEATALLAKLEALQKPPEKPDGETKPPVEVKDETPARPKREDFDDPDVYDEAVLEWGKAEGAREVEARLAAEKVAADAEALRLANEASAATHAEAQAARLAEITALTDTFEAKKAEATERYPDFESVTMAADALNISGIMTEAMLRAENSPDIAYFLAKNPAEVATILALGPVGQAMAMARLSDRLAEPPPPPPRPARNRPLEPVDTSSAPAGEKSAAEIAETDMASYYTKRSAELQRTARPFFPPSGIH